MLSEQRLADLEQILKLRYETLGDVEKELAMTSEAFAKIAIKQRIREEILPAIRKYEAEYWQILSQESNSFEIDETEAEKTVEIVVQEVEYIENNYSANFPDEVINRLTEIQKTLNTSDQTAAAKLKLALPLLPSVLSYELELDTEGVLRKIFQPIRRLFKAKKKSR